MRRDVPREIVAQRLLTGMVSGLLGTTVTAVGLVGLTAAVSAAATTADTASAVANASGLVKVAVVVDYGTGSGRNPEVLVKCLEVPDGTNGSVVLAQMTSAEGITAPSYATSGLLCSIGGYPASGCGTEVSGGYRYWAYWHGGANAAHWSYANVGPAEWAVKNQDVEGWRFENPGQANPDDPTPGASPDYAQLCPATTSTGGGSSGTPGSPVGGAGGSSANATAGGTGGTASPSATTAPAAGTGGSASGSSTAAGASGGSPDYASDEAGDPTSSTSPRVATKKESATTGHDRSDGRTSSQPASALGPSRGSSGSGGGNDLPLVLAGIAVILLGSVAAWRWRIRARSS